MEWNKGEDQLMKRVAFFAMFVGMLLISSCAFATTVRIPNTTIESFSTVLQTPISVKNDGEDRYYITLVSGTIKDGKNNSVFGGRVRRAETEEAVSHYETIEDYQKHSFPYIVNMNEGDKVRLHFKCDDTSPKRYMKVDGKFTG